MSGPVTSTDAPVDDEVGPAATGPTIERRPSRLADVGGMAVRRALPRHDRRTVGAWCFVDHFGPTDDGFMQIGPHPHVGLQTVTWLLAGEALHRDSLGSEQLVRPGQLNLMTSGAGIVHAEESPTGLRGEAHGAQLWVALPEETRHGPGAFEHHADLPVVGAGGLAVTVLVGDLDGVRSPARADTALLGLALTGSGAGTLTLQPTFEHALVVLDGTVAVGDEVVAPGELAYLGLGRDELTLDPSPGAHALLLGGVPFPERIAMWWNFVGRTKDEMAQAWRDWEDGADRFGPVASELGRIPAPAFIDPGRR
ncbi:MAG: putative MarR-family transcriptional regulator [Actinomycetia bacterium]|nr:putative MarR-family transcriptional regulator [Actinomycetes bacterium]